MALKAIIYKISINIADMDRHYYADQQLTVARHPSETELRLMLRILAWGCYADPQLIFTKGLSSEGEPDIWLKNDQGLVSQWIELGLPDEKRMKKACSQAEKVILFCYSARAAHVWWQQQQPKLAHLPNLTIWFIDDEQLGQLSAMAAKSMQLQLTLQGGTIWLSDQQHNLEIKLQLWKNSNYSSLHRN